ncbi:hypothetical protein [Nocardioides campestrisoli]|uniref:hypothetical protein n=1 Tax=Nocardioides campestrisoli TaxID=2736757 RepID=UPI002811C9F8|nr:hypothetical protein [Nocardioides campestrisoli]
MALLSRDSRFAGQITGVGTTSGVRAVVGRWRTSPLGAFADVMVETAAGHRLLLAPDEQVAELVAATYTFDEVRIEPVRVTGSDVLAVRSPSLRLDVGVGRRTALGAALRLVPARVATAPAWTAVSDPVSRVLVPGVRTRGSAGGGRREYYGATDVHAVAWVTGSLEGADLGALAPVDPPCRFGFSSAPRRPVVTEVVTTVRLPSRPA